VPTETAKVLHLIVPFLHETWWWIRYVGLVDLTLPDRHGKPDCDCLIVLVLVADFTTPLYKAGLYVSDWRRHEPKAVFPEPRSKCGNCTQPCQPKVYDPMAIVLMLRSKVGYVPSQSFSMPNRWYW
jgi:hypothetical protein